MSKAAVHSKEVAGVMLFRRDGALLLQHRDQKPGLPCAGLWSIPSGLKESSESPEECARRELEEETGYRCLTLSPLAVISGRDDERTEYLLTIFRAKYDGLQILKCFEGQALEFVERAAVSSYALAPFIIDVWDRAIGEFSSDG